MEFEYFEWLMEQIHNQKGKYRKLLWHLYHKEFIYILDFDRNRYMDGLFLRKEFGYESDRPCSVLEMLIELALRLEEEYMGDPRHPHPEYIFWEMIRNLKLDKCCGRTVNIDKIDKILIRWMTRRFTSNGGGSIFPLRHTNRDQRGIEIWSQAMEYLTENY